MACSIRLYGKNYENIGGLMVSIDSMKNYKVSGVELEDLTLTELAWLLAVWDNGDPLGYAAQLMDMHLNNVHLLNTDVEAFNQISRVLSRNIALLHKFVFEDVTMFRERVSEAYMLKHDEDLLISMGR
jgi:hypothetical protein